MVTWENSLEVRLKRSSKTHAIPFLSIYPGILKTYVHQKSCTHMFTKALFIMISTINLRHPHRHIHVPMHTPTYTQMRKGERKYMLYSYNVTLFHNKKRLSTDMIHHGCSLKTFMPRAINLLKKNTYDSLYGKPRISKCIDRKWINSYLENNGRKVE